MEAHPSSIWSYVADYLADDCTEEVRAVVEQWIGDSDENRRLFSSLRQSWELIQVEPTSTRDNAELKAAVVRRIGLSSAESMRASSKPNVDRFTSRSLFSRIAVSHRRAGYAIAASGIAVMFTILGWQSGTRAISHRLLSSVSVYTTANAQQSTITLPDGSTVVLNVASRLEVPADYATGNRVLRLRGEALFTVAHANARPFTVIAGPSVTRVLGTTFAVRYYEASHTMTDHAVIAVQDGKVAVGKSVVTANQQIAVDESGESEIRDAGIEHFTFASGILTIDDRPLRDVIDELNRWYDIDVRLGDDTLGARRIVGGFVRGSSTDLGVILERTLGVRVIREGRILTLYPKV